MTPKELALCVRSILIVLRDSARTEEIHKFEELTGKKCMRRALETLFADEAGQQMLREEPELSSAQVDYDWLRALPPGTFGRSYAEHLDRNQITADYQARPTTLVADPTISYLLRRYRQTHDIWHVLLNLGIQGHEEVIVHAFSLGQLKLPVSAFVVFFGTLKHLVLEGRVRALRHALWEAYQHGRQAQPLLAVRWETLWELPLETVRARFNVAPCTRDYVDN